MPLVSISDVIDATREGTRCLIEGERVLDAKTLISVGSLGLSDNRVLKVWGLCLQSSTLTAAPHVLETSLNLRTIYKRVINISCSCKAGKSEKCKHCIALLMYLNRINNVEELEDLSCTDLTQQWGKLKKAALSEFEAVPLTEFCHFVSPQPIYAKGVPDVSEELALEFSKFIIQGAPKSELFLHSSGARAAASHINCQPDLMTAEVHARRQAAGRVTELLLAKGRPPCFRQLKQFTEIRVAMLPSELLEFYNENVKVQSSSTPASNTALQSEPEWDAARKVRMTGTKVYPLYTYSRNKNPNWPEKVKKTFDSPFHATAAMIHGLEAEPNARIAYTRNTGKKIVENGIFVHPDLPWLGASVDGVVVEMIESLGEQVSEEPIKLIEIKSLVQGKTKTAAALPLSAESHTKSGKLKVKHKYYGQIQLGMFLTGLKECDFILYASGDDTFVSETILYDDNFVLNMLSPLVDIYFDYVLPYLKEKVQEQDNEDYEDEVN